MKIPKWLISLSVCVNEHTGGQKGYSLCARFHEGKLSGIWYHKLLVRISDAIFFFDKDHCRKAWLLRNKGGSNADV